MIKLKNILIERNIIKLKEKEVSFHQPPAFNTPYIAHQLVPPSQHAYSEPAGDKKQPGMGPYVSKQDFTGFSTAKEFEPTEDFIEYIKKVENGIRKGVFNERWKPYRSIEDLKNKSGNWEIGYGHKIKKTDNIKKFKNGLVDQEVIALLKHDLEDAKLRVESYLKQNRLPTNLSQKQWEMLIDYSYNLGGVEKFPEMVKAIVFQDLPKAQREYKRYVNIYGMTKELSRNTEFFNRYLTSPFN